MVGAAAEHPGLAVTGLPLSVIIDGVDILHGYIVSLLDGSLYLKLVGFPVNDEAVTVELLGFSRHLLGNYWLD